MYQFSELRYLAFQAVGGVLAARVEDANLSRLAFSDILRDFEGLAAANRAADGDEIVRRLTSLDRAVEDMAQRTARFHLTLGDITRTTDTSLETFLRHKDALLSHLHNFVVELDRYLPRLDLLWDACGVVVDDLASRVLALNVPVSGEGLGSWLADAKRYGTPFQVTLHQLTAHPIRVQDSEVFVCENPAVLRRAAQQLGPDCPPMLCTEGRASTAFHRLAHLITAEGGLLNYHGDFDWDGVDMANQIIERHCAQPWLMTRAAYTAAVRTDGDGIALRGKPRATPWAPDLAEAMARAGVAVFEEAVAHSLIASVAARVSPAGN